MGDYTVTASSELMQNFIQSDFLAPQDKFEALQASDGSSLLFSIGTGGALYLTAEFRHKPGGLEYSNPAPTATCYRSQIAHDEISESKRADPDSKLQTMHIYVDTALY